MSVPPIPRGLRSLTPFLACRKVEELARFLTTAFGAVERERIDVPGQGVLHLQLEIGDSRLMLGLARGEQPPSQSILYHYVEDGDAVFARAVAAGGEACMEPMLMPYGDRCGAIVDPEGNSWWIATHVEDVAPEETARRMATGS